MSWNHKSTSDVISSSCHTWPIFRRISIFIPGTKLYCGLIAMTSRCSTVGACFLEHIMGNPLAEFPLHTSKVMHMGSDIFCQTLDGWPTRKFSSKLSCPDKYWLNHTWAVLSHIEVLPNAEHILLVVSAVLFPNWNS